jgi:hypothetical protein
VDQIQHIHATAGRVRHDRCEPVAPRFDELTFIEACMLFRAKSRWRLWVAGN